MTDRFDHRVAVARLLLLCAAATYAAAADEEALSGGENAGDGREAAAPGEASEGSESEKEAAGWQWFSDRGRSFAALLADPREAQVRVGYLRANDGDSFLDLGFGGDLGFLRADFAPERELSFTVRGLIASRFEFFSQSFDQVNTDFIGGQAIAYREGDWSAEVFVYHQSSHLGDDALLRGDRTRIDLSFEAVRLLAACDVTDSLRLYGGPAVKVRADPSSLSGSVTLQLGAEQRFQLGWLPLYAAVDLQARDEPAWRANVSAQFGVELGDPLVVFKRQRAFIEIYNGFSNMGQFFNESEFYIFAGMGFTF